MELSDDLLRAAAGERMLRRAEHLVPCVHGLHVTAGGARGSVQARRDYVVEIDWSGADLDGRCTCPHSADRRFCKHLAALGLAVLDAAPRTPATPFDEQLKRLDAPALRDLVRELAARDPAVARLVAVRTSTGQEESLSESYADDDRWNRLRVDRMLLELADHRGDVDEAIDILIRDEHPGYGEVVDRLRGAGRDREVLGWMDRAVRAGRVSNRTAGQGRSHWLDPADVAATYLAAGRGRDALDVLRTQFQERPSFAAFDALVTLAEPLGQRAEERTWALATARAMAGSYLEGAPLIEVALGEGDLAAAWAAAQQFGPGHRWRELAAASTDTMPREAADLYRPSIEDDLRVADTRRYPGIADEVPDARPLRQSGCRCRVRRVHGRYPRPLRPPALPDGGIHSTPAALIRDPRAPPAPRTGQDRRPWVRKNRIISADASGPTGSV